jgi:DNA-binding MarR family transcriptional regulator
MLRILSVFAAGDRRPAGTASDTNSRACSGGEDMSSAETKGKDGAQTSSPEGAPADLPLERSVGYQVRMTHRALQRYLQAQIEPHGVTLGMWYFLRALWREDGITQRELSRRIGTMEPTTLTAISAMEREGLVTRVRDTRDRRKQNVFLTPKGRQLGVELLPLAAEVVDRATAGFSHREVQLLLNFLSEIQRNLEPDAAQGDETEAKAALASTALDEQT